MADGQQSRMGVVAIGHNEGERLQRCLRSIPPGIPMAYVDSASIDDSVAFARSVGADVVELDMRLPFSAARARNEGAARLTARHPELAFVQFVDGDCEFEPGWLAEATRFLENEPEFAAVCGRRRERYPEASFYNRLCDAEWNTPPGEAAACGGDAMVRLSAFASAGGYDGAVIAGEEPEFCARLRTRGWRVWRLDAPMTIHDADMHHFRQWWMRAVRSGYGYAQVWSKTRRLGAPLYGRELARAIGWSAAPIALALFLTVLLGPIGLLAAPLLWAAQFVRLARRDGGMQAVHLLAGKFAETWGALRYGAARAARRRQGAIYYK